MDSVSQIVLGAAVGEAIAGKKLGNKAIFWGAIGGTIPDLDVVLIPFLNPIKELSVHRGESHAFFYIIIIALIVSWLVYQGYKRWYSTTDTADIGNYKTWFALFFGSIITHPMLDVFTTYGTQIWLPFSRERVAIGSIFVADPLYTVPFMICVFIASRFAKTSSKRRFVNWLGIGLSCGYLLFTVFNQQFVRKQFQQGLQTQNISYQTNRLITSPTPLNNVMWSSVAETEKGYYMGLYSLLDQGLPQEYIFLPRNEHLIKDIENTQAIKELKWFSNDYYVIEQGKNDTLFFNDARFGLISGYKEGQKPIFAFRFKVFERDGKTSIQPMRGPEGLDLDIKEALSDFTERIKGV